MNLKSASSTFQNIILPAVLNSYSIIFFFNNKLLASILLIVTFFNFFAGLSGLLAVIIVVSIAYTMGMDKQQLKQGVFSFNALLTGIGMGTFFDPSFVFFSLLILAAVLTLILSVTLGGWLGKSKLPFLSLPFIISFWFVLLPSSQLDNLGLTQRNIYWINEMYSLGGNSLLTLFQQIDSIPINKMVEIYLRSMSSIFFQDNLIAGLLITITILICSRISFLLSIVGFLAAYIFAHFSGSEAASITYYNIGANYIMVALAIGGFFVIPSRYSFLWTILLVPITSLVLLFFYKLFSFIQLPVFSLPFSVVVILFVYFLQMRTNPTKMFLTTIQNYSPEVNLYNFKNNQNRLSHFLYFPIYFPFWGEWTVTQGHDGEHTHIDDWGKAFDFMIKDHEMKTYKTNGVLCDDYYCFKKPVLAPADGYIEEVYDNIDDNEIGKINTVQNWGNTIIIRHFTGLYTQLSHLKKGTFKVAKGDFVKRGDILALCGNSGRSPEPHLHFQVQGTPILGAKTIDYPFAYYFTTIENKANLTQFSKPEENHTVTGITENSILKNGFNIIPNSSTEVSFNNDNGDIITENWDAYTDAFNYKYLYCKETDSTAYYVNDGMMFYFTAFYGNKNSSLYYFYLSAYKIFLGNTDDIEIEDKMPLNIIRNKKIHLWIHDFIAPFHSYINVHYSEKVEETDNQFNTSFLVINSKINVSMFGKRIKDSESKITLTEKGIESFSYQTNKIKFKAICKS